MATIQIRVVSPSVTGIEHRKIEPIIKHLSDCKKNQSRWPNQINRSERNTKPYKSCIKEFREDSKIFIDNLIVTHNSSDLNKHTAKEDYIEYTLLLDAANATLQSETLWRNCVRCHNRKRWCKKTVKNVQNVCDDRCIKHGSDFSSVCDAGHTVQLN